MNQIRQGKFREDLYYRLNTVPIHIPSLKERPEDIPILIRRFAVDFAEAYHTESIRLEEQAKNLLLKYPWPGNIRELKNLIEQLSVLSEDKLIDAEALIQIAPHITKTNLPALSKGSESLQEREILYKLLFDMKGDLHDLKQLVFELIRGNNLRVPETISFRTFNTPASTPEYIAPEPWGNSSVPELLSNSASHDRGGIIIDDKKFDKTELIDDHLALEDMEKEMIKKSLKRHGGRRKEAATELGISERTLYRKIKQYDI